MRKTVLVCLALAMPSAALAQSITTLFLGGNRGNNGGNVYFDVNVTNPAGLTITSFDMNNNGAALDLFDVIVYTVPLTSVGNEANMAAWTQVATGQGTAAGQNLPSPVDTTDFNLAPGTYGLAITLTHNGVATSGHEYTNGPLGPYSNADIELTLGKTSNVPFTAPLFSPRVWNGTVYYSPVPEPASLSLLALGGLALIRRRR